MPEILRFVCSHCGKQLSAKPQHAGRSTRCPDCQKPVTVPEPEPVPTHSENFKEDDILQLLGGSNNNRNAVIDAESETPNVTRSAQSDAITSVVASNETVSRSAPTALSKMKTSVIAAIGREPIFAVLAGGVLLTTSGLFLGWILFSGKAADSTKTTPALAAAQRPTDSDTQQASLVPTSDNKPSSAPAGITNIQDSSADRQQSALSNCQKVVMDYLAAKSWQQRFPLMTNLDSPPPNDSPLTPPGNFAPMKIKASFTSKTERSENGFVEVDVSESHPEQPTLSFNLINTPDGFKIDAAAMLKSAAKTKERLEAARQAEEKRLRMEQAERAPPADGTNEFAQITTFPERYLGRKLYIDGTIYLQFIERNKQFKCFSLTFGRQNGEVRGGPWREKLSFVTTEEMGAALVELRARDVRAIVHVKLRYLDPPNELYPVGDVTMIEVSGIDPDTLKRFKLCTLHANGKVETHANPFK